jgi:AAA domain
MITIEEFTAGLDRRKAKTGGGFMARCPAHEDSTASLSIDEGNEGIVVKCFANCDPEDIVERMGFEMADLFYEPRNNGGRELEVTYDYVDEQGKFLYQVVRKPPKRFLQRTIDAEGDWVYSLDGIERVPYRLPELIAAVSEGRRILIPEGEKDVEAIERAGGAATCNAGGAGKWDPAWRRYFEGCKGVWVIADPDEAGLAHAADVVKSLDGVCPVEIRVAKRGKDAYDHLEEHGLSLKEFITYVGERRTVNYLAVDLAQPIPPTKWLIEDMVVRGEVTLLVGNGGVGKSFVAMGAALAVSGGETMYAGKTVFRQQAGPVLMVDEENSPDLVLERLHKLGLGEQHRGNLHYLCGQGVDLTQGPDKLIEDIKAVNAALVVIDSQSRVLLGLDENSNSEMSRAYRSSIVPLARETGAAVLLIHHTSDKTNKPRGATGIANAADQVLSSWKKDDGSLLIYASKPRRKTRPLHVTIDDEDGKRRIGVNAVPDEWRP